MERNSEPEVDKNGLMVGWMVKIKIRIPYRIGVFILDDAFS